LLDGRLQGSLRLLLFLLSLCERGLCLVGCFAFRKRLAGGLGEFGGGHNLCVGGGGLGRLLGGLVCG